MKKDLKNKLTADEQLFNLWVKLFRPYLLKTPLKNDPDLTETNQIDLRKNTIDRKKEGYNKQKEHQIGNDGNALAESTEKSRF